MRQSVSRQRAQIGAGAQVACPSGDGACRVLCGSEDDLHPGTDYLCNNLVVDAAGMASAAGLEVVCSAYGASTCYGSARIANCPGGSSAWLAAVAEAAAAAAAAAAGGGTRARVRSR